MKLFNDLISIYMQIFEQEELTHETPSWMDEMLEREGITWDEYYMQMGLGRSTFWNSFWASDPQKRLDAFRFEDFSKRFVNVETWDTTTHTTKYRERILRYMVKHPLATLAEARGHK